MQTWGGGSSSALIKTRRLGAFPTDDIRLQDPLFKGVSIPQKQQTTRNKDIHFVYLSKYGRYAEGGEFERGKRAYLLQGCSAFVTPNASGRLSPDSPAWLFVAPSHQEGRYILVSKSTTTPKPFIGTVYHSGAKRSAAAVSVKKSKSKKGVPYIEKVRT